MHGATMAHMKEKPTPPSSPLQKVRNPFARKLSPRSPSSRRTSRAALLVILIVVLVSALNELRCLRYGCVSRVGFYGAPHNSDRGGHVGGGAVIGGKWKISKADFDTITWASILAASTPTTSDKIKPMTSATETTSPSNKPKKIAKETRTVSSEGVLITPTATPHSFATVASKYQVQGKEAGNGKWMADNGMGNRTLKGEIRKMMDIQKGNVRLHSPPKETPARAVKAMVTLSSISTIAAKPTPALTPLVKGRKAVGGRGKRPEPDNDIINFDMRMFGKAGSREGEPDDYVMNDDMRIFGKEAMEQHSRWEQGEGQEDPVRVSIPSRKSGRKGDLTWGNDMDRGERMIDILGGQKA